jgi:hypothetical protein
MERGKLLLVTLSAIQSKRRIGKRLECVLENLKGLLKTSRLLEKDFKSRVACHNQSPFNHASSGQILSSDGETVPLNEFYILISDNIVQRIMNERFAKRPRNQLSRHLNPNPH